MNILVIVLGLIFGSFLGVIIDRLPLKISIVSGRSRCDTCNKELDPIDLIPIVSFIIFKGKCRRCKTALSYRYPLLEIITALAFIMVYTIFGYSLMSLIGMILASILICVSFIDLDTMYIYDRFHLMILGLGLILLILDPQSLSNRLLGLVVVSIPYLVLAIITQGIGGGDVKLIGSAGLVLGWQHTILAFLISILIGGTYGIILMIRKKVDLKDAIPFGPFLCIGIFIAFLYGEQIINIYLSLF